MSWQSESRRSSSHRDWTRNWFCFESAALTTCPTWPQTSNSTLWPQDPTQTEKGQRSKTQQAGVRQMSTAPFLDMPFNLSLCSVIFRWCFSVSVHVHHEKCSLFPTPPPPPSCSIMSQCGIHGSASHSSWNVSFPVSVVVSFCRKSTRLIPNINDLITFRCCGLGIAHVINRNSAMFLMMTWTIEVKTFKLTGN